MTRECLRSVHTISLRIGQFCRKSPKTSKNKENENLGGEIKSLQELFYDQVL